jgi:hypothetical protein
VPGLPGEDRVEHPAGGVPVLELRHLDFEPAPAGVLGHPRVDVDPENLAASGPEQPGDDARPDADVEHVGSRTGAEDALHHGVGISRPGSVVAFRVRTE